MPSERSASALRHIKHTSVQLCPKHDWTTYFFFIHTRTELMDYWDVFGKFWLIHYSSINLLCSFIGGVFTTYWSAYIVWIVHIPSLSIYCILCVNQQLILHELSKWGKVYQYCKLSIAIRAHKKEWPKIFWIASLANLLFMAGPLSKGLLLAWKQSFTTARHKEARMSG